jgi:hypothetical protein
MSFVRSLASDIAELLVDLSFVQRVSSWEILSLVNKIFFAYFRSSLIRQISCCTFTIFIAALVFEYPRHSVGDEGLIANNVENR